MFNYKLTTNQLYLFIVMFFTGLTIVLNSCNNEPEQTPQQIAFTQGKLLAEHYCANCHRYPSPSLIDKHTWLTGVLPAMGKQLGVRVYMGQYFSDLKSSIGTSDWLLLVDYYKNAAPEVLKIPKPAVAPLNDFAIFTLQKPAKVNPVMPAMTSMVAFDTTKHQLYTGDVTGNLFKWNAALNQSTVYHFDSAVTGINFMDGAGTSTGIVTTIGTLPPVNLYKGKVFTLNLNSKGEQTPPVLITDSLPRPIQTVAADFNKDGLMDYVTCGFGHDKGALYLSSQQANHTFKKSIIKDLAGGEQLITGDFNNDGWPDVMCLFAQADESIWMFLNDHKGGFTAQNLLRFPPIYGSTSFQLVDLNHDGKPDILYTCGDNSDYSKVLKPYHGVYIFTNQGNWKFKQTYFYHINGCSKAIAADFDHDGDYDIAAIAFFADFKYNPQEGFTYLEQTSPNKFTAHQPPITNYGRWLTMAVADIDHDGYDDIILGNFSLDSRGSLNQSGYTPAWDKHIPLIVLKNNSAKAKK